MYGPGGHLGHLGHVTNMISEIFISMYLKAYIQNLVKTAKCFLRKPCFNFQTVMALGQGQEMTLTFNNNIPS